MKVDFFMIGAPKCGTSAVAKYLGEHPQICFSKPKEPGFFNADQFNLAFQPRTVEEYHAKCFAHFDPQNHRILGEGTTNYLYYEKAVPRILEYNPDAKLIIMLRNPVKMVVSWHREMLRWVYEDVYDLEKAWKLQPLRAKGEQVPKGERVPFDLQYKANCLLGQQVQRVMAQVDRSQLCCLLHDDLVQDPGGVYAALCSFLGVEQHERREFEKVHVGSEWKSELQLKCYAAAYRMKMHLFGAKPLPFGLDNRVRGLMMRQKTEKTQESEAFIQFLKDEFRDDVALLSELVERDLTHWVE